MQAERQARSRFQARCLREEESSRKQGTRIDWSPTLQCCELARRHVAAHSNSLSRPSRGRQQARRAQSESESRATLQLLVIAAAQERARRLRRGRLLRSTARFAASAKRGPLLPLGGSWPGNRGTAGRKRQRQTRAHGSQTRLQEFPAGTKRQQSRPRGSSTSVAAGAARRSIAAGGQS